MVRYLLLSSDSVVNAERQADNLLSDDHQRACDVDGVGTIVVILTMQVNARQISQRNHHNGAGRNREIGVS